ncbi:vitelline envelope sperm lysin receptor-like [Haliotis rufescens]|uniref:vitelline envelope sperm lysin receptor-like n=1 Tax=Haliotis rufescens TaxID=6454 RepID=UPI001EB09742|nr:vitelline envelope sperm lysin receptor-like [Haliotis rufescens]XP_046365291.1 vitelline envelope sperm lysin receptor-like [Haliotis rufescens]
MTAYIVLAVFSLMVPAWAPVPPGYVFDISPECGVDGVADGFVTIMTDMGMEAKAICAGGKEVLFSTEDFVFFGLPISYPGKGSSPCVFEKKPNAKVFTIEIHVSFGEAGQRLHSPEDEFKLSCSFQPEGKKGSKPLKVSPPVSAPLVLQGNKPPVSKSHIKVMMVDVLGRPLTGGSIAAGKMVRLKAFTLTPGDKGIQAVSCNAVDSKGNKLSMLRDGCGDGMILAKDKGFVTKGTVALSYFFRVFTINGDAGLQFECKFSVCSKACDGASCVKSGAGRRRRAVAVLTGPKESPLKNMLWTWRTQATSAAYTLTGSSFGESQNRR